MSIEGIVEAEPLTAELLGSQGHDTATFEAHLQGDAVLVCSGDLDRLSNPAFRRSLRRLARLAPDRSVVDLSRVPFFDASAIGELARARNSSRAAGGDLVVRAPSAIGRRLLGIVGMANLIDDGPGRDSTSVDGSAGSVRDAELAASTAELADRFTAANESGVVIDEAKGLIAEHFDVGIDEASVMLRAFSIAQQQPVLDAAVALMDRTVAVVRLAPLRPGHLAAPEGDIEQHAPGRAASSGT